MAVLSLKEREVRVHLPVDNKDRVIYKKSARTIGCGLLCDVSIEATISCPS